MRLLDIAKCWAITYVSKSKFHARSRWSVTEAIWIFTHAITVLQTPAIFDQTCYWLRYLILIWSESFHRELLWFERPLSYTFLETKIFCILHADINQHLSISPCTSGHQNYFHGTYLFIQWTEKINWYSNKPHFYCNWLDRVYQV